MTGMWRNGDICPGAIFLLLQVRGMFGGDALVSGA